MSSVPGIRMSGPLSMAQVRYGESVTTNNLPCPTDYIPQVTSSGKRISAMRPITWMMMNGIAPR